MSLKNSKLATWRGEVEEKEISVQDNNLKMVQDSLFGDVVWFHMYALGLISNDNPTGLTGDVLVEGKTIYFIELTSPFSVISTSVKCQQHHFIQERNV